jgi:hypothetical protein
MKYLQVKLYIAGIWKYPDFGKMATDNVTTESM